MDIHVGTGLVPSSTQGVLCKHLGILAETRGQRPEPMVLNIIDPNVGAVDDTWVPTEFHTSTAALIEVAAVLDRACRKATGGRSLVEVSCSELARFMKITDQRSLDAKCAAQFQILSLTKTQSCTLR